MGAAEPSYDAAVDRKLRLLLALRAALQALTDAAEALAIFRYCHAWRPSQRLVAYERLCQASASYQEAVDRMLA